jgi:hypothetical protein
MEEAGYRPPKRRWQEALESRPEAARLSGSSAGTRHNLAQVHQSAGSLSLAREQFSLALKESLRHALDRLGLDPEGDPKRAWSQALARAPGGRPVPLNLRVSQAITRGWLALVDHQLGAQTAALQGGAEALPDLIQNWVGVRTHEPSDRQRRRAWELALLHELLDQPLEAASFHRIVDALTAELGLPPLTPPER